MRQRFTLKIADHLTTPEKKRYYNTQVFTEIAPEYDVVTRPFSFWRDQAWKRRLVALLPAHASPTCVDLACGTGDITFLLAHRYPQGRIVGLDITEPMLERAAKRNTHSNTRFIKGDMGTLPVPASSVDIVTGSYALRNAPDLGVAIAEVARVLRPGGVAGFLDFSKPRSRLPQILEYGLLKIWGSLWGAMLHGNPEVYGYVAESLRLFPDRTRLRQAFSANGLDVTGSSVCLLGILEMLVVQKTLSNPRRRV